VLFVFCVNLLPVIAKWIHIKIKVNNFSTNKEINTLLFADDQVIIEDSKDKLQRGIFTLQNMATNFGMEISTEKSETMEFLGKTQPDVKSLWITNVYKQ
jgi:hypothetical protein